MSLPALVVLVLREGWLYSPFAVNDSVIRESGSSSRTTALPDDLLADARRRLGWACVVLLAGFSIAYVLPRFVIDFRFLRATVPDIAASVALIAALALGLACRNPRIDSNRLISFGLVLEVVCSFAIATSEYWEFYSPAHIAAMPVLMIHGISWVCVWIIVFPALVPAPRTHTIVATLIAASSTPLVFVAGHAYHAPILEIDYFGTHVFFATLANAVCAGFAIIVAMVIRKLGRKVHEARQLGSYTLVSMIGHGGMGEVWRAEHRLLARPAAVKLIRPEALDASGRDAATVRQRFEREAQVTASLVCPNTIDVYDFGVASDGRFYYVMELLDGINLEELVQRFGPLAAERAVHLLIQACSSLAEAHARGLVHRDVKPANLFCCRYGLANDFIKVLDFGLARAVSREGQDVRMTGVGTMIGTPAFMAPEQILAETESDARADVYALGCVAYWLLTGELVFAGKSPMQMVVEHLEAPPLAPSLRSDRGLLPELDQVVLDCLAKRRDHRPASMRDLQDRLEDCRSKLPAWTGKRAAAWWAENLPVGKVQPSHGAGLQSTLDDGGGRI